MYYFILSHFVKLECCLILIVMNKIKSKNKFSKHVLIASSEFFHRECSQLKIYVKNGICMDIRIEIYF